MSEEGNKFKARNVLSLTPQSLMDFGQELWCYINIHNHVLPLPTRVLPQGGEGGGQLLLAADQGDVYVSQSSDSMTLLLQVLYVQWFVMAGLAVPIIVKCAKQKLLLEQI